MKPATIKIFGIVLLASFLLGSLFGCSGRSERGERFRQWMTPNGKVKILSSIAQIGDLVEEIGSDRVDNWVLISGDLDPHSYELVKGDDEKISRADALFYNGLGLEHGASLSQGFYRHPHSLAIGEAIKERAPGQIIRTKQSEDPHIWMDISLWMEGVDPIVEMLTVVDPENALFYRERGALLKEKMGAAHREIESDLQNISSEKRYLVTSHDAFHYFTRSYLGDRSKPDDWRERFAAPEGLAPDGQLNPVDIAFLIDYLKKHQVSILFPESNVSRDSIKKIVSAGREMGLKLTISSDVLYGDAMDKKGEMRYLDMMRHNADVMVRHWGESP